MDAAQSAKEPIQKRKGQIQQKGSPDIPAPGKDRVDIVRKEPVYKEHIGEDAGQLPVHDKSGWEAQHIE